MLKIVCCYRELRMVREGYKQYGISLREDRADKLESIMASVGASSLQKLVSLILEGMVKLDYISTNSTSTSDNKNANFIRNCKVGMGFEPIYTRSAGERIAALPPHHERNSILQ